MTYRPSRMLLFCVLGLAGASLPALAQNRNQDLEAVRRAAEEFARSQAANLPGDVLVGAGEIDSRLQLVACQELHAFLPAGARLWGRSNVGVRCRKPDSWSIIVPVNVQVMADALFSARPLARGAALTEQDIVTQRVDLTQLPAGTLTDRSQVIGRVPGVSLAAGLPMRAEMLRGAYVVTQGQSVRIEFSGDGFKVSSDGKALGNAALGEYVQVRAASGKVVKGMASSAGVVEVK